MEPKWSMRFGGDEGHPNHDLRIWRLIPREMHSCMSFPKWFNMLNCTTSTTQKDKGFYPVPLPQMYCKLGTFPLNYCKLGFCWKEGDRFKQKTCLPCDFHEAFLTGLCESSWAFMTALDDHFPTKWPAKVGLEHLKMPWEPTTLFFSSYMEL